VIPEPIGKITERNLSSSFTIVLSYTLSGPMSILWTQKVEHLLTVQH